MAFTTIALMLLMLLAFWFLVLRPQRRRQAEHNKRVQSLQPGTRVMLASGVYATLTAVGEKTMRAEIAPGVEIEVMVADEASRRVVGQLIPPGEYTVQLVTDDTVIEEQSDRLGRFTFESVGVGPVKLVVVDGDGNHLVTTEWVLL